MRKAVTVIGVISVVLLGSGLALTQGPQSAPMTFFITSNGSGEGADLGGLAGADAICQRLATDVGAGDHTWRAYLSTQGPNAVNARDRIGTGPWHNAQGTLIGNNVNELHGMGHRFTVMTVIDERGRRIPCTAPGFLDSGLTVFASTPPRPARGGRVAPGPGFGSRTSPASTARCTSA